jgi:predicted ATPase
MPLDLPPARQRQRTMETLVAIILECSKQRTTVLIFEDLHWTDPTTLELLDLLLVQVPVTSLYILLTCRPEFQPSWSYRSYLTEITVDRLLQEQIEKMAEQVAGGTHLPKAVLQQIIDKTDGIPLFIEEITKAVLESVDLEDINEHYEDIDFLASWSIPATLQDSLMARLDRLMTAKAVAQYAAVIGRQFSYGLLHAVSQMDASILRTELRRLVEAELLYQSGFPPHETYLFKHALLQEVTYQSVLKSTRHHCHQQIAHVLTEQFPDTVKSQPEWLAYHYTEAGLHEQAINFWQQAGEQAIHRSANLEAINHLTQGLELLEKLPMTLKHTQQRLMLYVALGASLMATKGSGSPEARQAYNRARELCQQIEEPSQNFPVLFGVWRFYLTVAQLSTAKDLMSQLLRHAQRVQDLDALIEMHLALGCNLFFLGDFVASQKQFTQGISYYKPQNNKSHIFLYGNDPMTIQLSQMSLLL